MAKRTRHDESPGAMRFDRETGRWMRFTGRRWVGAPYSLRPDALRDPAPLEHGEVLDDHRREQLMLEVVESELLAGGTLVSQRPTSVVLDYLRPIDHTAHAVGTVLTGGLWGVVWIVMALARRSDRARLAVDDWGHVWPDELPLVVRPADARPADRRPVS